MTISTDTLVADIAATRADDRFDLWAQLANRIDARAMLELGVYRGEFAEQMLQRCAGIQRYTMIDPWQHLGDWNKPANVDQSMFDAYYQETLARTDFARDRRTVLRGRTVDVIDAIPDHSLDIAYIDADHTLRGIAIDLMRTYSKVRPGGILGGDDYTPTIFEPSLVCPFAAYFAEAHGMPLVILPHCQFAMVKPLEPGAHFRIIDTTGSYGPRALLPHVRKR